MKRLLVAAEKGDAGSQFNVGVLYNSSHDDNGRPIGSNRREAIRWLREAARQGLPRAQMKLAEVYADGLGSPRDYARAGIWFLLAATNLSGAQRERAQSGYDRIAAHLTPADIARAKRLADVWKPTGTLYS